MNKNLFRCPFEKGCLNLQSLKRTKYRYVWSHNTDGRPFTKQTYYRLFKILWLYLPSELTSKNNCNGSLGFYTVWVSLRYRNLLLNHWLLMVLKCHCKRWIGPPLWLNHWANGRCLVRMFSKGRLPNLSVSPCLFSFIYKS